MNQITAFLLTVLQAVIIAAVPVITTYLCKLLLAKRDEVITKIKDENAIRLYDDAMQAVITAVTATNQTYVDALKKDGKFNLEEQERALMMARSKAKQIMSEEAKDYIGTVYGCLNGWLTNMIEAQVKVQK